MKRKSSRISKGTRRWSLLLFLSLSLFAYGQELPLPVNPESMDCYLPSGGMYNATVGKAKIYELSDEFCIKKRAEAIKEDLEQLIYNIVPDAQISWIGADYCTVVSQIDNLKTALEELLYNDDVVSLRPVIIRQAYLDLMALYPVKQVKLNCFDNQISAVIINEFMDEALALISSLGMEAWNTNPDNPCSIAMNVSKDADVIKIANSLNESGLFKQACPSSHLVTRVLDNVEQNLNDVDYYYTSNDNKVYLYKSPGRFGIKKSSDAKKTDIESLLADNLKSFTCNWVRDELCLVDTDDDLIDDVIEIIRKNNQVVCSNRTYMIKNDYEFTLAQGLDYPRDLYFDETISIYFYDGVTQETKDSLRNAYNLSVVAENRWAVTATMDILSVCRSLYLSGHVRMIGINYINGISVEYLNGTGNTTGTETHYSSLASEEYYNLSGMSVDSPKGITIVLRRYTDGSIRTERILYP